MTARSIIRWAGLLALLTLVLLPATAATKWLYTGYVQGRFTDQLGDNTTPSTFRMERAYLFVHASVDDHVGAAILVGSRGTFDPVLNEAYGEYVANTYQFRLGLSRLPFGYEVPLSSSRLITLERSQVSEALTVPFTFDRGAFAYYLPGKTINFSAGLVNGESVAVANDTNNYKNQVARLGYSLPGGGEVGVSTYLGRATGATPVNIQRYGFDVEKTFGAFTLIGEAVAGDSAGVHANGAYLTAAYQPQGSKSQPYLRYDFFDPNEDAAGDYFSRVTVGYSYYLNPTSKLTLEYQNIDNNAATNIDGNLAAQYQVIF